MRRAAAFRVLSDGTNCDLALYEAALGPVLH
jgi:hypothetical protein